MGMGLETERVKGPDGKPVIISAYAISPGGSPPNPGSIAAGTGDDNKKPPQVRIYTTSGENSWEAWRDCE